MVGPMPWNNMVEVFFWEVWKIERWEDRKNQCWEDTCLYQIPCSLKDFKMKIVGTVSENIRFLRLMCIFPLNFRVWMRSKTPTKPQGVGFSTKISWFFSLKDDTARDLQKGLIQPNHVSIFASPIQAVCPEQIEKVMSDESEGSFVAISFGGT